MENKKTIIIITVLITALITASITAAMVVKLARFTNQYYQGLIQSESSDYQPFLLSKELAKEFEQYGIDKIDFIYAKNDNGIKERIAQFVVGSREEVAEGPEKLSRIPNEGKDIDNNIKYRENSELDLFDTHAAPHLTHVASHLALLFATATPSCPPLASWEPSSCRMMAIKKGTNLTGTEDSTHCHCFLR